MAGVPCNEGFGVFGGYERAEMEKTELHQARLDVERMRKAADRLDKLEEAYAGVMSQIAFAEQGLKIIATWARVPKNDGTDLQHIATRATDTLRLMGCAVKTPNGNVTGAEPVGGASGGRSC